MTRLKWLPFALGLAVATLTTHADELAAACGPANCKGDLVYIGTQNDGPGQGIVAARFDPQTGHLTAVGQVTEVARPTWLLPHPKLPVLYSVSEVGNDGHSHAAVYSFSIDPGTGALKLLDKADSGGGGATHLALDTASSTLFVANYGTGQVTSLPVLSDGSLGNPVSNDTHAGSGPSPRQKSPHAHGVTVDPGHHYLLAPDLGDDRVYVYRLEGASHAFVPADPASEAVAPGSGPRHLVFHPNGRFAYLLTELSAEVITYRWDARHGRLTLLRKQSLTSPGYEGKKSVGEIAFSHDGRTLYVSDREQNDIVVYDVDARSGALGEVQRIGSQGQVPWHFTLDPTGRWLLVANQASGNVSVFKVDPGSGKLAATSDTLAVTKPVNVVFLPRH